MTNLPAAAPAPLPGFVPRDRTLLMGVLNVTPDSFSDGGRWVDPEAAVAHARELIAQGADIIDVGGESTRPGAQRVDVDTEISRVLPVVRALLADTSEGGGSAIISVDTIHAATAEAAIDAGAHIINDVSGGLAELDAAGVDRSQVVLDPGLGFAKTHAQSWELLAATARLVEDLGQPLLVGSSRKRFLALAAEAEATPVQRDAVTAATTALAAAAGAWAVRVHEVPVNRAAVRTASLWKEHQ